MKRGRKIVFESVHFFDKHSCPTTKVLAVRLRECSLCTNEQEEYTGDF
jgi:hypothetical protein